MLRSGKLVMVYMTFSHNRRWLLFSKGRRMVIQWLIIDQEWQWEHWLFNKSFNKLCRHHEFHGSRCKCSNSNKRQHILRDVHFFKISLLNYCFDASVATRICISIYRQVTANDLILFFFQSNYYCDVVSVFN